MIENTENSGNAAPEEKRVMSLYDLEYSFIPFFAELYRLKKAPVESLVDKNFMKEWLQENLYSDFEFDFNELACDWVQSGEEHIIIRYVFPEPYESHLAKFGAILLDGTNVTYYTLEKSVNVFNPKESAWVLGSVKDARHYNFGNVGECDDIDAFKALI